MKVTFTHKSGRVEVMDERFGKVLQGLKKGTYLTRDMRPQPAPVAVEFAPEPAAASASPEFTSADALEEALSEEKDSAGVAWDPELHTQTRLKNLNGTWRKRPR